MKQVFDEVFDYWAGGWVALKSLAVDLVVAITIAMLFISYPLWAVPYYLLCRKRKGGEENENNER